LFLEVSLSNPILISIGFSLVASFGATAKSLLAVLDLISCGAYSVVLGMSMSEKALIDPTDSHILDDSVFRGPLTSSVSSSGTRTDHNSLRQSYVRVPIGAILFWKVDPPLD
jgi:hypothetical protein